MPVRTKGDINFGFGVFHSAVFRARLRRRRKMIRALLLLGVMGLVLWVLWPVFQGQGTLVVTNLPPDGVLLLDEHSLTGVVAHPRSGRRTLQVTRPGFYPITMDLRITRAQTTTLAMPSLRPRPAVQPIPLPAPGATWQIASSDPAGGWRLSATAADVRPTPSAGMYRGLDPDTPKRSILRLDAVGLTRLSVLEAYSAADEQLSSKGRFWAVWESLTADFRGEHGHLTISTPAISTVITTTQAITGLWWGPAGRWLLIAAQHGVGQDLVLWSPTISTPAAHPAPALAAPVVTIPGQVAVVHWSPDGRAVVIVSTTQMQRDSPVAAASGEARRPMWDATLILPNIQPDRTRALRLAPPPAAPLGLIPLAWSTDALFWTADMGHDLVLSRIPFATALPARVGTLPSGTLAHCVLADDQIRVLVRDNASALTLQTWPTGTVLFTIDEVPAGAAAGLWSDTTLLLATSNGELWQLTFAPEALQ
jgi:hypothetical protein